MTHIAICDDEIQIGAELERALIDILQKHQIKHEITIFFTGSELCKKMEGNHYDLIFLDIELARDEINGIEVSRLIRDAHQNYLTQIVFISWEKKYAPELFDVQPLNFLVKPLMPEKIEAVICRYLSISGLWSREFKYKTGRETSKAKVKDIVYIESRNKKLIIHLASGRKIEFYGSLKDAYGEQLCKLDFLYIHAAYAVNYDYVSTIKAGELYLINSDAPLPISKPRKSETMELYYAIMKRRTL